jgi:hypothetical protein
MIPDAQLGVAVLTNQESEAAFESITDHVLDAYVGAPSVDWIAALQAVIKRSADAAASKVGESAQKRDAQSKPSLPLQSYAGRYRDQWYGDILIASTNGGLTIKFDKTPGLSGTLEHWQHDTFIAKWTDRELRADAFITFALTPDGAIDSARMEAVSPETDFSFDFQDLLLRPAK